MTAREVYDSCIKENSGSLVLAGGDTYCLEMARKVDPKFSTTVPATPPAAPTTEKKGWSMWTILFILVLLAVLAYFFFFKK